MMLWSTYRRTNGMYSHVEKKEDKIDNRSSLLNLSQLKHFSNLLYKLNHNSFTITTRSLL